MLLVRGYRLLLKPWLGNACRFEPTCSAYALEALQRHGALAGSYLAGGRCCAATRGARRLRPGARTDAPAPVHAASCRDAPRPPDPLADKNLAMTDMRRTLLWVVFTMSLVLLWDAWNKHTGQPSLFGGAPRRGRRRGAAGPQPRLRRCRRARSRRPCRRRASGRRAAAGRACRRRRRSAARRAGTVTTDVVKATFDSTAARWCGSNC